MTIPPATDEIWKDLLLMKKSYDFDFLALKMLLGRLTMDIEHDPSPENLAKCAEQLHGLLAQNANLPTAKRDLEKILG
ncbi:MAG: hypothetical protein GX577_00250 [Leptolinea sp.]|nr:hypothetical protein [Leptolinea sp.]